MNTASRVVPVLAVWLITCATASVARAGDYTKQIAERDAVQKGVDFLVQGSVFWIRDRGCFTCHAVGMGAFATGLSARNGYLVNQHDYDTLARFVLAQQRPDGSMLGGNRAVSLSAVVGAGFAFGSRDVAKGYTDQTGRMARFLIGARSKEGDWEPDYQSPVIVTGEVMTSALASIVLRDSARHSPDGKGFSEAAAQWRQSLNPASLVKPTDVAFALLGTAPGAETAPTSHSPSAALTSKLCELQNPDGGWPVDKGGASNTVVTGQALFALASSGVAREEPHVSRAIEFLFKRQRTDGTWVPDGQGQDYGKLPQTYTRTAWAVAGLSSILDVNGLVARRSEVIGELTRTLDAGPPDPSKLHRLARAQLLLRDTAAACQSFERLVALSPQHAPYRLELARAYLASGDKRKAADAYQKALKVDLPPSTRPAALQTMAECLEETGDKANAAAAYVELVNPRHSLRLAHARRLLPKIASLGGDAKLAERYRLVTEWEISGPFPCESDDGLARVFPPEKGEESQWQRFVSKDPLGVLDLTAALKSTGNACGYARLLVTSPVEKQVQLRLGTEGSFAVWLNGKEVHRKQAAREIIFDEDKIDLTVPSGSSTLLVKVCQNKGRWSLVARLAAKDGTPLDPR